MKKSMNSIQNISSLISDIVESNSTLLLLDRSTFRFFFFVSIDFIDTFHNEVENEDNDIDYKINHLAIVNH